MNRLLTSALVAALAACAPAASFPFRGAAPAEELAAGVAYPAVAPDAVEVYNADTPTPPNAIRLARIRAEGALGTPRRVNSFNNFRIKTARRGATGIYVTILPSNGVEYLAVYDPGFSARVAARADSAWKASGHGGSAAVQGGGAQSGAPGGGGASSGASTNSGGCVSNCTVQVRGYTRKDGTYVRPHTRSRPGTRSSGSRRPD